MFTTLRLRWFLRRLKSKKRNVRQSAADMLGKLGDSRAVEPLIQALLAPSGVRYEAAEALGKLGDQRAVEPLVRALAGDASPSIRCTVAEALGKLGDQRAVGPLIKALGDTTSTSSSYSPKVVCHAAAEALSKLGEPEWVEMVKGDPFPLWKGFQRLGGSGDPRAAEPLMHALKDATAVARVDILAALGRLGDSRAVDLLIQASGDKDPYVRMGAVDALGDSFSRLGRPIEFLILALGDTDKEVRIAAVKALRWSSESRGVEPLIRVLRDKEKAVRGAAADALGWLGDVRALEPLLQALNDVEPQVRRCTAEALGKLGDARAVEPLMRLLDDGDAQVREYTADALGKLGDVRAVEPLIRGLRYPQGEVRIAIAKALKMLQEPNWKKIIKGDDDDLSRLSASGDPRALEPLIMALDKEVPDSHKKLAAEALGKAREPRAVKPLLQALRDKHTEWFVRWAIVEALGELGDVTAVGPLIRALGDWAGETRRAAAKALSTLHESEWQKIISGDSQDLARLGASNDPRAVDPLMHAVAEALRKNMWPELHDAAQALGKLATAAKPEPQRLNPLKAACRHESPFIRAEAARALGEIGDASAVECLIGLLSDQHPVNDKEKLLVAEVAADAILQMGQPAVEPLISALDRMEWNKSWYANVTPAEVLARTGDPAAIEPLRKALQKRYANEEWWRRTASPEEVAHVFECLRCMHGVGPRLLRVIDEGRADSAGSKALLLPIVALLRTAWKEDRANAEWYRVGQYDEPAPSRFNPLFNAIPWICSIEG